MSKTERELFQLEKELYSKDLYSLNTDLLGYNLNERDCQGRWDFVNPENKFILFLAPRGVFKTTDVTIGYTVQRVLQDPNLRVLLTNATKDNAVAFLRAIKQHLKAPKVKQIFGTEITEGEEKWAQQAIILKRSKVLKEPTVSVAGVFGNIVSQHNDLIICDDVVNDDDLDSPLTRERKIRWFLGLFDILEPGGQLILVGTRWHPDDLYGYVLENLKKRFKDFVVVIHKAIIDEDMEGYEDRVGKAYFESRFPFEELRRRREHKGTAYFLSQYMNDVTELLGGTRYRLKWLEGKRFTKIPPGQIMKFQGVDLQIAKGEENDYFVIVTIGFSSDGKIWLLNYYRGRLDFAAQMLKIKEQFGIWKPTLIGIENNAYQDALPQMMRASPEYSALPVVPIRVSTNKVQRLTSLAPLFEFGTLRVKENMPAFEKEYREFPNSKHDDILDALFLALQTSQVYVGERDEGGFEKW